MRIRYSPHQRQPASRGSGTTINIACGLSGHTITKTATLLADFWAEVDAVLTMYPDAVAKLEQAIPNLTKKVILPGAGHWIQQERPTEVNRLLMEFLKRV